MNDIEQSNRSIHIITNPLALTRRSQRQRISPSPEPQPNHLSSLDYSTKMTNQLKHSPSDTLPNPIEENNMNNSPSLALLPKKTPSTSDLDSSEHKKQLALAKVEAKLDKAQRLYQTAQQSVEQNISEFLRVTTIPGILHESKTTNAAYEKRIRTLQETKKELEKKIATYHADILRIQSGDIPQHYSSSKDILNTIKNKVSGGISKQNSTHDISTTGSHEQVAVVGDTENHPSASNNHNLLSLSHNSNTLEVIRSSPSNSISNEIGSSVDSNYEHAYDRNELSALHDMEKSPSSKRRLTDDSNIDRISDHSSDDRYISYNTSKRNTMPTTEQLIKIDLMQKSLDRYESKLTEMQKQLDSLTEINKVEHEENERLNDELRNLTDLYQIEMSAIKTDSRKLEDRLVYNFNECWAEMVEKLDKLETRTTKVEQTQTHSLETEENTHRIITKFVNILLTVFAIILLLLSTIKNLVQSRVHAVILLILVFTWITIHYLPDNYFQRNFTNLFKRSTLTE